MPYWLRFVIFLLVANVVVFTIAHWLTKFGAVVKLIFAVVAALLAIVIGRRVLNRERV
ncbi:MAG: hypothetical protein Q8S00_13875 [Deltaproteobacteria bacterium]|nr:hypothetical protein [Deltaproteobacteria bacterium]MDZ4346840.1 hypothetical protein [Candidatus Binatia bacterium]